MSKALDTDALERALERARASDRRRRQIDAKLQDEPWRAVAEFAAYCCQCEALSLKPWEQPPMHAGPDDTAAQALLRRMRAAGLSRFEPDPLGALERAE